MEHNKINLDSRSKETQDILKDISGKGLKWGIYTFVLMFIVVMVWIWQLKFPNYQEVGAKKVSDRKVELVYDDDKLKLSSVDYVIIGNDTIACDFEVDKKNKTSLFLEKDLPTNSEVESVKLISEKNIIQIMFSL